MDSQCYGIVHKAKSSMLDFPFAPKDQNEEKKWYVLVEATGASDEDIMTQLESYTEKLDEQGIFNDMVVNQNITHWKSLWTIRESVAESSDKFGLVIKYDLSLDQSKFQELVDLCREKAGKYSEHIFGYGHIGDGNIHLNIICKHENKEIVEDITEKFVIDYITNIRGSISAEHGLGIHKTKYIRSQKNDQVVDSMIQIKKLFDPNNIMNPGKVFE